jgi:hypothetical protein
MRIQGLNLGTKSFKATIPLAIGLLGGVGIQALATAQTVSPSAAPSPLASPSTIFESVTLGPNFTPDPTVIRGISGGPLAASQIAGRTETATGPCNGYIDQQPDHTIVLTQFFNYLSIQVESTDDTTIVVRGPGGTWCNDDYMGNKNPGIAGQWLAGTYQIWVGSYKQNLFSPYVIRMTESH